MSSNGSALEPMIRPGALPARVGQATAVEQSRAVAEVQAAVIVAQQCPRSVTAAIEAMQEACSQPALAGRAFFRFERGKDPETGKPNIVTGPSVHLARELARTWGNIQHGITELARDDEHGESEMQAWAWDVQTNTRSSNTFIVPHKRDTRSGVRQLTQMRDIYDNNANNGARRLREAIFSVLPTWYTEQAKELCQQTNERGGGKPLAQRIADAVKAFEKFRVSPARIAAKYGYATVDELTATDVAQLGVVYSSLNEGAVTVADEFPEEAGRISPSDLAPPRNVPPAAPETPVSVPAAVPPSAEAAAAGGTPQDPAWQRAMKAAQAQCKKVLGDDDEARHGYAARILRVSEVRTFNDLTTEDLREVASVMNGVGSRDELEAFLTAREVHGE